jgi:hypothetical protein
MEGEYRVAFGLAAGVGELPCAGAGEAAHHQMLVELVHACAVVQARVHSVFARVSFFVSVKKNLL